MTDTNPQHHTAYDRPPQPKPEDYTGEDGLLYCGKCRKPKEAYFPEGKTFFGRDRHPSECDCQRAARKEREAAEKPAAATLKRWNG